MNYLFLVLILVVVAIIALVFLLSSTSTETSVDPSVNANVSDKTSPDNIDTQPFVHTVEPQTSSQKFGDGSPHTFLELNAYTPQQVGSAYLHPSGPAYSGAGQKIAIIVAYNHAYLQRDFDVFCNKYGLPNKTLQIHNFSRRRSRIWGIETCLDVQWCHVFAPGAEIHIVQAASSRYSHIKQALLHAATIPGMNIVSMSLGSKEYASVLPYLEPIFANNPNITFMAASGDWSQVSYPSSSPNVISVGGTRLHLEIDGKDNRRRPEEGDYTIDASLFRKIGETDWSTPSYWGAGHGISKYFERPAYQDDHNASQRRSTPDLSLIASSPSGRGVSVYYNWRRGDATNSRVYNYTRAWIGAEGTSVSCPILAGMLATINSERINQTKQPLNRQQFMEFLYNSVPTNLPVETSHDGVGYVGRNLIPMCVAAP